MAPDKVATKMCLIKSTLILCLFNCVLCSDAPTKSLTESMGQEIIEMVAPVKDLPQELEEEPSAESEEVNSSIIITTMEPATRHFSRIPIDPNKKIKDIDKIDGRRQQEEEARIEKELADIYKDSLDYKADSGEVTGEANSTTSAEDSTSSSSSPERPVARGREEFKLQPDSDSPREVARFRTSIDEISCDRKLSATKSPNEDATVNAAGSRIVGETLFWTAMLFEIYIHLK